MKRDGGKTVKGLLLIALFLLEFPSIIDIQPVDAAVVLTQYTGTSCSTVHQTGFGIDNGFFKMCLSNSHFSYSDNAQANFTINAPSISGLSGTVTTWKNSTTLALNTQRAQFNIWIYIQNTTDVYAKKIIITGTRSGPPSVTLSLPMTNSLNQAVSTCNSGSLCKRVLFGHLGFDWSDASAFSPSYNNLTKTLSFTIGTSFTIDPIAFDTGLGCANGVASSCDVSITTTAKNDVIIASEVSSATKTCVTPTSSPSLTFTLRKDLTFNTNQHLCEYYTTWSSSGAITVTCKLSAAGTGCGVVAIKGADTTNIFDTNTAVPCSGTGTGTSATCSISTDTRRTMIVATCGTGSGSVGCDVDTPDGWVDAAVGPLLEDTASINMEYQLFTSAQSNLIVKFTLASSVAWGIIGDAVREAGQISESIALTQNLKKVRNDRNPLTSAISLVLSMLEKEIRNRIIKLTTSITQTFKEFEARARAISLAITQTQTFKEFETRIRRFTTAISLALSLSEFETRFRSLSTPISLALTLLKGTRLTELLTTAISLASTLLKSLTLTKSLTTAISMVANIIKSFIGTRILTSAISLSTSFAEFEAGIRNLTSAITLAISLSRFSGLFKSLTSAISLALSLSLVNIGSRSLTSAISLSLSLNEFEARVRTLLSTVTLSDILSASTTRIVSVALSLAVSVVDSLSKFAIRVRQLVTTITASFSFFGPTQRNIALVSTVIINTVITTIKGIFDTLLSAISGLFGIGTTVTPGPTTTTTTTEGGGGGGGGGGGNACAADDIDCQQGKPGTAKANINYMIVAALIFLLVVLTFISRGRKTTVRVRSKRKYKR